MNIWEFMSGSPWLTFFLLYITLTLIFKMTNRYFRHRNIKAHGWPPEHCDADGDFKDESE